MNYKSASVFNLSCDDVLGELDFVIISGVLRQDIFSLVDQRRSLFVDLSLDVLFDRSVRVGHLSDDKVKEN